MTILIRKCSPEDLELLQQISIETFTDTFGQQNSPDNLKAYLEKAYNLKQLKSELSNDSSSFFLIYLDSTPAGYLKLNINEAQTEKKEQDSLEIERIYIYSQFKRRGLGKYLINKAIEEALSKRKSKVWLGVWEKNVKAINFYEQAGFVCEDSHAFWLGNEEQVDLIYVKYLK